MPSHVDAYSTPLPLMDGKVLLVDNTGQLDGLSQDGIVTDNSDETLWSYNASFKNQNLSGCVVFYWPKTVIGACSVHPLSYSCLLLLHLEHKTCDILAAERLQLMIYDNRLIIDSFQEALCILK